MAYAEVTDIQKEFKKIDFSTDNAVTSAAVSEFITQEEAFLNASIATIYSVPITGKISKSIMKKMTTILVKARLYDILVVKSGKQDVEQGNIGDELREQVLQRNGMLAKILKQELLLTDADKASANSAVRSYNSENGVTQTFKRESSIRRTPNQW